MDGSHEGVERGASVALAEVGSGEAADETVDAEAAHGFVAQAEARVRITAHDKAPPADDLALVVDGEDARPEGLAGAAGKNAEVIRVLEVFSEHDVAVVQECRELCDREVPHTPGVLILVGDAGVEDEAPPRRGGLVDSAERLDEEWDGTTLRNHLDNALPGPRGDFGPKGDLSGLVAFPTGVVGSAGVTERETRLGHSHASFDNGGGDGVERAEPLMPVGCLHEDGHDVAGWRLLEPEVLRKEPARGPGREDAEAGRGRAVWAGKDRVRRADSNDSGAREKERKGVWVGCITERQALVR